ncbi:MAG: glycosyltransferase family 1 protein [bacterium]
MKIAIEARALKARGGGIKTYTEQLIRHLPGLDSGNEYIVISDKPRHELLLPLWLQWQMPRIIQKLKPDVVHFTKADVPKRKMAPTVVTIFDIIPLLYPAGQTLTRRLYWPRALQRAADKNDQIITISETSKEDIIHAFGVHEDRITVTPLAVDTEHFRLTLDGGQQKKPYVLFVGTLESRKNVPLLIRAFARMANDVPHQLVIAGRRDSDYKNIIREVEGQSMQGRVKILDFVEDNDLPVLYSGAQLFVWPSIYEGWGFPPQEAMACGTPVIVSDGGALPEVVGRAGEVVPFSTDSLPARTRDVEFEESLAAKMLSVLNDQTKRKQMRQTGLARVRQFSWQEVAEKTAAVYKQV